MNGDARLFWSILRTQLPVPLKITLFAMALHGCGLDDIKPGLARVGHFRSRAQRVIRRHVADLVTLGLLIPRSAGTGGYANPTDYSIGYPALKRYVDESIPPPETFVSPRLLKFVLYADLKPHRKLLLWMLALLGEQEFPQELLARALFRSTSAGSLEQLRRDLARLDADGLITRKSSTGGAGRGIRCHVQIEAVTAIAMAAPPRNPRYQRPPSAILPFVETPGTDRTRTPGTDIQKPPVPMSSDRTKQIGSALSVVSGGDERPVHAVENSPPPSPSTSDRPHRSTDWRRASNLGYELLRAAVSRHLDKRAVDYEGVVTNELRGELREFANGWCARHGVNRGTTPARRSASSPDITARVVDDVVFRYEQQHGKRSEGGAGAL